MMKTVNTLFSLNFYILFSTSLAYNLIQFKKSADFSLLASKHRASYGSFIDRLDSKKIKKIDNFQKTLDIDVENLKEVESKFQSGDDLRKSRNRDLNEVKRDQKEVVRFSPLVPKSKRSKEDIDLILKCLNTSYGYPTTLEELTDDERVGLINWEEFDKAALQLIENYSDKQVQTKIKNWIIFHRRKNDIRFEIHEWIWKPRIKRK